MNTTEWENCYPSNWRGIVTPESMSHPAKYSSKLIRRIYEHMIEMGWLKPGDKVIDPFGGVALGALDAMRLGLDWTGIELEEKFFRLGNVNIFTWMNRYGYMPRWGSARLLHGDSRHLLEIVGRFQQAAVSSPPFEKTVLHDGGPALQQGGKLHSDYGQSDGQLGNMRGDFKAALSSPPYAETRNAASGSANMDDMRRNYHGDGGYSRVAGVVSSPPYAETDLSYRKNGLKVEGKDHYERPYMDGQEDHYGSASGQLGAMKAEGFDAAISSPPFLQSEGGQPEPKPGGAIDDRLYARHAAGNKSSHAYGESDGQLSSMKDGSFDAAISSPPYDETDQNYRAGWGRFHKTREPLHAKDIQREAEYGTTEGQLSVSDDFWIAARQIIEQVYLSLAPGGHAVWVTKRYVKGGKIVEFSQQWAQLCEAVGFRVTCWHHAMLVHKKGSQHTLDGGLVEKTTQSKSFFRRLAESKGSPKIDWEDVICMVKP
jgi:hypothetical protein